jgi:tripartite-type tricarboxylate transporter receptor subunit TctC
VSGAGGTIGSARVAAAPSDGYTLLAGSMGSHVAAPVLTPNLKYDSERDFAPIGFTAQSPAVIVARKDFPANNLREFVDYLKQNGDRVKQAHGGIGASSHMACLLFTAQAGVKPSLVAYRGTAPALNDLIGGHVDFFCEQVVSVAPQIAAGTIKAYAISSSERLPTLPDVPTAKEAGLDYQMSIWAGIFAPKGTPKPIVDSGVCRSARSSSRAPEFRLPELYPVAYFIRGRGGDRARDHSGAPRLAPLQVQWPVLNLRVAHFRGEGSLEQPLPSPLQVAMSF